MRKLNKRKFRRDYYRVRDSPFLIQKWGNKILKKGEVAEMKKMFMNKIKQIIHYSYALKKREINKTPADENFRYERITDGSKNE